MSFQEAQALAERVRAATHRAVIVESDEIYFVVVAGASGDTWTVRDEQDWAWMQSRITSD